MVKMWKRIVTEWFVFSKGERRGIAVLSALLLLAAGIPVALRFFTAKYSNNYQELKLMVDTMFAAMPAAKYDSKKSFEPSDFKRPAFYFDPNTIPLDSLLLLGFTHKQAMVVINYRQHGGFRSVEQFLRLSVVSRHQHLKPFVRIAWRQAAQNIAAAAKVDSSTTRSIAAIAPIDINHADTMLLKTLPGIGSYLARRIVEYRQKLGGYTTLEQLCEIKYFDPEKLNYLRRRLTIDKSMVVKIPLSKDGIELLRSHPYCGAYAAKGIAQYAKYSGGAAFTLSDLVQNNIITAEQAQKLSNYVVE
jgi:DNA uptake protein ComE-like DNA-binding protein